MAVVLHGVITSSSTRRALAAIFEKEVEYRIEEVDTDKGQHRLPAHVARQPFAKIPALVDADVSVFESRAIVRHVAEKYAQSGPDLLGQTIKERAAVNQWAEVESQELTPLLTSLWKKVGKNLRLGLPLDEAELLQALEQIDKVLDIYDNHLALNKFLAGDFFSIADLNHLPRAAQVFSLEESNIKRLKSSRPNVERWWAEISERPSWVKIEEAQKKARVVPAPQ